MPYIKVIEERQAGEELQSIYEQVKGNRGKLSNIMKIHSLNPRTMKTHMDFYLSLLFGKSGLSREEREFIGVITSLKNNCDYCVKHHAEALNFYWRDSQKLEQLQRDPDSVELSPRLNSLRFYASKLTETPDSINSDDAKNLRNAGFSDEEILMINLITGYFNFVNRVVLGLGVEFTEEEVKGYNY